MMALTLVELKRKKNHAFLMVDVLTNDYKSIVCYHDNQQSKMKI